MATEIVLDLRTQNIEKVFDLPWANQYLYISYEGADKFYRENEVEAKELVQSKYLIDRTSLGQREGKVDLTHEYMIDDIRYSIVLLNRAMGLLATSHLGTWSVHFIENIRTTKMPIDWATILSDNLDEELISVKIDPHFYMTSYTMYLLVARTIDYPGLYKKGSM